MISLTVFVGLALALVSAETEEQRSYENHKVVTVLVRNERDAQLVRSLEERGVDLWTAHLFEDSNATMLLSPELERKAMRLLHQRGVPHWVVNENFQETIDAERAQNERERREAKIVGTFARYSAIETWLKSAASSCGNLCVLETIGRTYEGRSMYVMRIGENVRLGAALPRIFTDSTIHAREWLAQAAHIWIIDRMISKFGTDAAITAALKAYEFNFVVVANPDGYEYAHTRDRMWRKTRSPNTGSACAGTDPNRNFGFAWGGEGTSSSPCSEIYKGTKAFSELETQAVSNYILKYKTSIRAYIAQHTFCQMILVPYGHTTNSYPADYSELLRVAQAMASAMRTASGKSYQAGNTAALLSPGAGGSDDWAKGTAGIKYSYTIELRPTCSAANGFVVNSSEITPAGTELLAALTTLTKEIK